ncbi:hypothetical protein G6L94_30995 [Agrobacterium rhizogenes]|uniref:hypothetical protein n=1 Tax=Rhizobium rhizogenes TaxID=359 RepID=UPI00080FEAD9|nr:hypothetical protein [Rhizobium rhizogenes]OCJ16477.1 hypothetical protein A6U88_33835 [Agrobacterium sp. B131/95]OCJ27352.1 hypothetical protein A6U89_29740 [Agrobacterium sp. B133/95]NTI46651.1 hypothetical protein [Rhizobium rhizogenes]NTI52757.1 hypothetical protein [Rhizobium rhizogenes]NTI98130.1 hypothetical protein [Rhizobium rhizogenes]
MVRETLAIELEELPDLASRLLRVREIASEIETLPDQTYAPLGSELAPVEWFSLAAVAKSTSNAHAFEILVGSRNTIAAAAIIRMQIEAAMRLFGLCLVDDVESAGVHLMGGGKYSALRMRDGTRLVDKTLHLELTKIYEWVTPAYEDMSAYVHLDRVNIGAKMVYLESGGFFNLSGVDAKRPDEAYHALVDTLYIALRMTRDLLSDFLVTRPQPPARQAELERRRREKWHAMFGPTE